MRNILIGTLFCLLCGCRVEMLQLLGATIDSNEARAQRGLAPRELVEAEGLEELAPEEDLNLARFEFDSFADGGIPMVDAGLGDGDVADAQVPFEEICVDVEPGGTCPAHGWSCPAGFYDVHGNGRLCQENDECLYDEDDCAEDQVCVNTAGSFECHPAPPGAPLEPETAE